MKNPNTDLIAVPWGKDVINPLRNTKQLYLRFLNSGVFSEDGRRFLRYGYYTDAPKGTLDYTKYWDEQWNRCVNGYTVGGVRITGRHYFYLNFCPMKARPIDPVTGLENITARKKWTLPRFLDHSYYFFNELEECMAEGPFINGQRQGMCILKSRRKGFTYQLSDGAFAYNFVFLPHSMSLLAAYEKAHYKVTLDGIHSTINHVNKHTPWVRRREVLNQREHFRASFKEMNDNVEVEEGYLSEIHAVSFKDNPFKGIGECLAKGTGILMSDGRTKLVEEIVPGDNVMGIDSTPRNVLSVHNGTDNMYKIIPAKGDSFIVNSKHKHYLYDEYTGEYIVKTTEELLNKTKWQHARYKLCLSDRLKFSAIPVQLDPYMMGVWLGDGHSNSFSITTMDEEIKDAVYDTAKEYRCSVRVSSNGSRALAYHLNSESALKYIISNDNETLYFQSVAAISKYFHADSSNIYRGRRIVKGGYTIAKTNTPNDALNYYNVKQHKHIPDDYLYNSVDNRLKLLAGIIDTDGCLVNDKSYYEIHQKDKVFAEQILYLCRSLGFYSKISVKTKRVGDKTFKGYRIILTGNIWEIPVRIERKKASKRKSWINNHLRTTFKVESCGEGEYYGFELDKDHLFIMDNFFITHNSLDLAGFEEAGKFEGLLEALAITEPTYRDGDIMTGVPLVWGCVCAGTKVWKANGDVTNIEDLSIEDGIVGFDNNAAFKESIVQFKEPFKKPCYRITTNTGNILECSNDHPVLWSKKSHKKEDRITVNGKRICVKRMKKTTFKAAENIKSGDQVAIINSVPIFSDFRMWEPRLVGMLIGDGSYGFDKTPVLSNCDTELNTYVYSRYDCITEKEYATKDNRVYKETRIRNICPELRNLGIYGQTKSNKRLPKSIFLSDKYSVTELLGGLFDTDGYVYVNKKNKQCSISLTSCSYEMLLEVKTLLIKLGIHGSISKIYPSLNKVEGIKDVNPWFVFSINDYTSAISFATSIRLLITKKQEALEDILKLHKHSSYVNTCVFKKDNNTPYINTTGCRFETVKSVEFIGEKDVYNMMTGTTHTYIASNIITHNTGGDIEAGGMALGEFFYNPKAYGFKAYENIYDENATGDCGWFVDDLWYLPGEAHMGGKKIYMVDAQGNSIRDAARDTLMKKRDVKKQGDPRSYKTFITQQPLTPKEALMRTDGDFFDVVSAQDRLSQIETNPKIYLNTIHIGRFSIDDTGDVLWKPSDDIQPVREFPIRDNKNKPGAIEIFEHPIRNDNGIIPAGLYIAGIDPYDDDESTTDSLGCTFIMNMATDRIVAEYTGRPPTAYMYYENVRRLLMYYNALAMYENAKKGLFTYFDRMNCTYLLADTPKFLKDIELVKTVATGNSAKGFYPSTQVNAFGRGLIRNWSVTPASGHPDGVNNMSVIRSMGLLRELVNYNTKGNFDRVSAMIALMLLREEIGRYITSDILTAKIELKKDDKFFSKNYGNKSWQNQILFGNR